MRFMQFNIFYPAYLRDFYAARPQLPKASHHTQIEALLDDGFSESHIFSRRLKAEGFETFQVALNDVVSQGTWLRENNIPLTPQTDTVQVAAQQIERFKPDIVYTTDVTALDRRLFAQLKHKPRLIAGWRGFPLPAGTDLSSYDLILTSFDRMFDEAKACGAKAVERFHPGFAENASIITAPRRPEFDVVFSGSVTGHHTRRIAMINILAELSRDPKSGFSFGLFVADPSPLSPLARSLNQPARWGHDMLRLLRNAGMVVNIDIDDFSAQPPNMRLIEATGAGAFLITPDHRDLPNFFEPGVEVETFRTPNELVAKVLYYLREPQARAEIAARGQARCLRDHSLAVRTPWFRDILLRAMDREP